MGVGTVQETFANIKTPLAAAKRRSNQSRSTSSAAAHLKQAANVVATAYRPRYLAHIGMFALAAVIVFGNNPTRAHGLAVRLLSAHSGVGQALDPSATASVAAVVADKSSLLVAHDAIKSADTLSQAVAIPTSGDIALAKPQVVATAGNATRDITTYTVAGGDTLSTIASKFNITTATIEWANNLSDADAIKPGQSLTILPVSGLLYTVGAGDTAASLASSYQANAAQILSFNDAEVKGLTVGSKIIIPDGVKPQPVAPAVTQAPTRLASTSNFVPQLTSYSGGANGYSFGYCTWYVATRRSIPPYWGDARNWYYNAQASGFSVGSVPEVGAIAWTGAGYYGHVAYVVGVSGGSVTISEMNYNGGWDRVDTRTVPASSFRYIY